MKLTRGIYALQHLVGVEMTVSELVADVRSATRQTIPPQERDNYRGITYTGTLGTRFGKLFNVDTMADLVIAEETGAYMTRVDHPNEVFFFASERGLVAAVAPVYAASILKLWERIAQHRQKRSISCMKGIKIWRFRSRWTVRLFWRKSQLQT
ncbi:hypothetical protein NLG97_g3454 [Lecanicillium saksenae]|uniref:Uncharacterized protein n=1 Tax=Lecanicillium saksenae TaxID=468837 RepID=A0ACC1QY50_9HYPO|nr:hypothetical protein NLG97_g3454 [Lecanicillium saksenae]